MPLPPFDPTFQYAKSRHPPHAVQAALQFISSAPKEEVRQVQRKDGGNQAVQL